jgi:hypothetical protein
MLVTGEKVYHIIFNKDKFNYDIYEVLFNSNSIIEDTRK